MHIPAISSVNYTCGTQKGNNNNTSFGAMKIVGDAPVRLARAIKSDYSIQELADVAEKRFNKDIVVDVHKKTLEFFGDLYKLNLYVDNGFWGNLFNKFRGGRKISLTSHHHRSSTLDAYINFGLLHRKNISTDNALERLGLK